MSELQHKLLTLYAIGIVVGMLALLTLTVEQAAETLIETPIAGLFEIVVVSSVIMGICFLFAKEVLGL